MGRDRRRFRHGRAMAQGPQARVGLARHAADQGGARRDRLGDVCEIQGESLQQVLVFLGRVGLDTARS